MGTISPFKIKIEYDKTDDLSHTDLAIYYSFTNKNPSAANHDKKYTSKPKYLYVHSVDESGKKLSTFNNPSIFQVFLSFISEVGCSLEMTLQCETLADSQARSQKHLFVDPSKTVPSEINERTLSLGDTKSQKGSKKVTYIPPDDPYYLEVL